MALIKCKECGHEVSDKAEACPNCGCPVEKKIVCEECGEAIGIHDITCPKCGCPVQKMSDSVSQACAQPTYKRKGIPRYVWFAGAGIIILLIGLASIMNHKNEGSESADTSLQERIDQPEEESEDTFTTFKGTYITSKVVMQFYNNGYSSGVAHKDLQYTSYSELKSDAEESFDMSWTYAFGRPSDEKLRKVYNECKDSFMKGWKEGMGERAKLNEY